MEQYPMLTIPRVVSIEDDFDNFKLIQLTLQPLAIELYHAANGNEALKMTDQLAPDLVLLDLALPDANGWELLKQIRERTDRLKGVIVLSVRLPIPSSKMAQEQVDACFGKPFMPSELRNTVRSLLSLA